MHAITLYSGFMAVVLMTTCSWAGMQGEIVRVEQVEIYPYAADNGTRRILRLVLSPVAPKGCPPALNITETYSPERLLVNIPGSYYRYYRELKGNQGVGCPRNYAPGGVIDVDHEWLERPGRKEVAFMFNGQRNVYSLFYEPYRYQVTLDGVEVVNVIPIEKHIGTAYFELRLFPLDVAILCVHRLISMPTPSQKTDYRPALRRFAEAKGLLPAEQVYPGIEQRRKNCLLVVMRNRSRFIDSIYYDEPLPGGNGESVGGVYPVHDND